MHVELDSNGKEIITPDSFDVLFMLGKGSFG
jgi:hypothetical protein